MCTILSCGACLRVCVCACVGGARVSKHMSGSGQMCPHGRLPLVPAAVAQADGSPQRPPQRGGGEGSLVFGFECSVGLGLGLGDALSPGERGVFCPWLDKQKEALGDCCPPLSLSLSCFRRPPPFDRACFAVSSPLGFCRCVCCVVFMKQTKTHVGQWSDFVPCALPVRPQLRSPHLWSQVSGGGRMRSMSALGSLRRHECACIGAMLANE